MLASSGMEGCTLASTCCFGSSDSLPKYSLLSDEAESGRERLSLATIAAGDTLPVPRRMGTTRLLLVSESQLMLSVRRFDIKSVDEKEEVEDTESRETWFQSFLPSFVGEIRFDVGSSRGLGPPEMDRPEPVLLTLCSDAADNVGLAGVDVIFEMSRKTLSRGGRKLEGRGGGVYVGSGLGKGDLRER